MTPLNIPTKAELYTDRGRPPRTPPVDPAGIPAELKALPRWCVWVWKWVPKRKAEPDGPGRHTKVPRRPPARAGGPLRAARSNVPETWATFEECLAAARALPAGQAGVGFFLGDDWVGVDLDLVRDPATGGLRPWAAELLRGFGGCVDLSPSDTGVKLIGPGVWPLAKNKIPHPGGGEVEVYAETRFFTFTGRPLAGDSLTDLTPILAALAPLFAEEGEVADDPSPPPERPAPEPTSEAGKRSIWVLTPGRLTDEDILWRAKNDNGKFGRRWSGDDADYNGDASAGDMALACDLVFWCGPEADPERVDGLFRRSPRMRDKWDERHFKNSDTYGERTVARALKFQTRRYTGMTPSGSGAAGGSPSANGIAKAERNGHHQQPDSQPRPKPRLVARKASTIQSLAVKWLWRGYIPFGMLSEINGDPGEGKGSLSAAFAAHATLGRPFPFARDEGNPPVNVLWLSAEDSAEHAIKPRLEAAGADTDRVHILSHVAAGDKEGPLVLPDHLPEVEEFIAENEIKLVIVDPLNGFLSGEMDSHNDANVRAGLLYPLQKLAERTGAAFVSVRHLNKMAGGKGAYRAGGSIAFTGAARVSLMVGTDPKDTSRRALAVVKTNVGPKPTSLEYEIVSFPLASIQDTVSKVQWVGPSTLTAEELGAAPAEKQQRSGRQKQAEAFLMDVLADGPIPALRVMEQATEQGITAGTLRRAREGLKVEISKTGFGGASVWSLPAKDAQPPLAPPDCAPLDNSRRFPSVEQPWLLNTGNPLGDDPPFNGQF